MAAIPTKYLVEELIELQSRATIVGRVLGDEVCRAQTVVVLKLKAELEASANSLKTALEVADTYREETTDWPKKSKKR